MRRLYLVRHASPAVQPAVPPQAWRLSAEGADEARRLAEVARDWKLAAIYSSSEEKASATALLISDVFGLPVHVAEGFEELRIDGWIGNADAFNETVRTILEEPDNTRAGAERASSAAARFAEALRIVDGGPFPAAVVSHGRVITAFFASLLSLDDPFALWRSIPMPGWTHIDIDAPERGTPPLFLGLS